MFRKAVEEKYRLSNKAALTEEIECALINRSEKKNIALNTMSKYCLAVTVN